MDNLQKRVEEIETNFQNQTRNLVIELLTSQGYNITMINEKLHGYNWSKLIVRNSLKEEVLTLFFVNDEIVSYEDIMNDIQLIENNNNTEF